jgi:uncharacterized GH25 family protein
LKQATPHEKGEKNMKKRTFVVALCFILAAIPYAAQAHMLWLNASNYAPKAGEAVSIEIGFGHHYPRDEVIKEGRLERVYAVDGSGKELSLEQVSTAVYKFIPPGEGAYEIIAVMKPGFVSKTTEGRKMGSKKECADAVDCFAFRMVATALISVGSPGAGLAGSGKNPLEVIALKNPRALKVGDAIPVKVTFHGKPVKGAKVQAATGEEAPAAKHEQAQAAQAHGMDQHWAQEVETDGDGVAMIKVTCGGPWMFTVNHEVPYEDKSECDRYSYRTSLTVGF